MWGYIGVKSEEGNKHKKDTVSLIKRTVYTRACIYVFQIRHNSECSFSK